MKAKKPAAKSNKKPSAPKVAAKSKNKKTAVAAANVKKPVIKSVSKTASAVKKVAAKPATKHKVVVAKKAAPKSKVAPKKVIPKAAAKKAPVFSLKSAAVKFKNAFSKKSEPAKKQTPKKPVVAVTVKPTIKAQPPVKADPVLMPKGMLTEERIRKMSDKEYMNDSQLAFFRYRLLQMRNEVLAREVDVKERLHQREVFADPADRATAEEEHWLDLRLRERESLLLRKIDEALRRIAEREFGYCEKTGDAIGIPRLLARPTATVCVDVKGQDERIESQFRDR